MLNQTINNQEGHGIFRALLYCLNVVIATPLLVASLTSSCSPPHGLYRIPEDCLHMSDFEHARSESTEEMSEAGASTETAGWTKPRGNSTRFITSMGQGVPAGA